MPTERHLSNLPLSSLRIGFAGTPEFAQVALASLLAAGAQVEFVFTQPDRPAGRGMKAKPSAVKQFALEHHLPVFQPVSLKNNTTVADLLSVGETGSPIDVLVVAAYGLILPQFVLDIPRFGCLNIHASLLPRWRGAAPIHRAIEAGDEQTGICIMQMEAGLDTGAIRLTEYLPIEQTDTTRTLHDKLAQLGGKAIVEALFKLQQGILPFEVQSSFGVTYANKVDKSEGVIDWSCSALLLHRKMRAFDPYPGCSTGYADGVVKVFDPEWVDTAFKQPCQPGTVLSVAHDGLVVQTGQGAIRIGSLQKPGGRRLPSYQVALSLNIQPGICFGSY